MAISLNREGNEDGSIDLTICIATTQFFNEVWEKALQDTNARIFKENGSFSKKQLGEVLYELNALREWAKYNLTGKELKYMEGE